MTMTFEQWLAATDGGAGPTRHWPLSDTSGTTMVATTGGINGTYQNTADVELNIVDPLAEKRVGFNAAAGAPGHATVATALQSAAFTAMALVQFDLVKSKHVLLTTGGGTIAGQFSVELIDDGAGGLKPRVWSVNDSGQAVVCVGSDNGSVPVGTACALLYVRRANGTQEVWCVTSAGTVTQIGLTLSSGTPPGSWSAHPAGTWYLGAWPTGVDALSGVARSLVLWDVALSLSDISALGAVNPQIQNVVWARAINTGSVAASTSRDNLSLTADVHPKVGFTPSIVAQGTLGTYGVSGPLLTYAAGATPGPDTAGTYKITKGGIDSPTRSLTTEVLGGALVDLPFFGQYYGGVPFGASNAANLKLRAATLPGDSFFFRAERTGVVSTILMHWRNFLGGYAAGNGGTYTIQIRNANPTTRLPITTGSPICQVTGINPGVKSVNDGGWNNLTHTFTTAGQTIAKQPYCIVWLNTHASPNSNHVSCNIGAATEFQHVNGNITAGMPYAEPAGINPASVSSSIAAVRGWSPLVVDGTIKWHEWPALAEQGNLHYGRLGGLYGMLRYGDREWVAIGGGAYGGAGPYKVPVSGSNQLRERFCVTRATRVVSGVFLRIVRLNASGGSVTFSLESGPVSDTAGNGTVIEQVSIPAANIFDVGPDERVNAESGPPPPDPVPWTWVPFAANRTLTVRKIYNARLFSPSGSFSMWCPQRSDTFLKGPWGAERTWEQWETERVVAWTSWEDSRAMQQSTNAGTTWAFFSRMAMILFKCV